MINSTTIFEASEDRDNPRATPRSDAGGLCVPRQGHRHDRDR
jgi:hypothetical protein